MSAPVPTTWRLPPVGEVDAGLPVFGRTLTTIAGALNHLQGWHCRGFAATDVWQGGQLDVADSDDVGFVTGQPEAHGVCVVPYYVPTGVDWIHAVISVLSVADGGSGDPTLTATVETASGGVIDDGCEWERPGGLLPGAESRTPGGTRLLIPYRVETSESIAQDATPGGPVAPRRLYVGSEQGSIAIVRIVTTRARVTGVHIIPEPVVTL